MKEELRRLCCGIIPRVEDVFAQKIRIPSPDYYLDLDTDLCKWYLRHGNFYFVYGYRYKAVATKTLIWASAVLESYFHFLIFGITFFLFSIWSILTIFKDKNQNKLVRWTEVIYNIFFDSKYQGQWIRKQTSEKWPKAQSPKLFEYKNQDEHFFFFPK